MLPSNINELTTFLGMLGHIKSKTDDIFMHELKKSRDTLRKGRKDDRSYKEWQNERIQQAKNTDTYFREIYRSIQNKS